MGKRATLAKISCPRLFGAVPRERLFTLLDDNRGRPLVWVSGPPGAGKTTLLASYLKNRGWPILWYQVDAGDADPASLFHYLSLAAESLQRGEAVALPRLVPEHLADLAAFARLFFRAFFSQVPEGALLVLDNYQEAQARGPLDKVLVAAAAEVSPGSSIYCLSRSQAPASLAQLAATGALFHLPWEMLRLTLDETREISATRNVRDDWLVRALHQQSEGWAAGVTLMLERLAHGTADAGTLPTDTHEAVFNYFASLLFDRASESARRTLLSVAFLPHVTASMARTLSGCSDAGEVLDHLYRRHLFIDRRPGAEPVYQFHALFRAFLQLRVHQGVDQAGVEQLLVRSARALEGTGDIEAAMDLWVAAAQWEAAAQIIVREARALLASGRRQTLERWIRALPPDVMQSHPWLIYWLGMAQVQTEPGPAIETLRTALARFRDTQDTEAQVLCLAALLNAAFIGFIALDAMDGWLDELLAKLGAPLHFSSSDSELRVWGVLCSALFWNRPWHPWTAGAAHRVETLLAPSRDPNLALAAASSALATTCFSGEFECGDRIALATEPLADGKGASPAEAAWWLVHAGFMRFFEARYEQALELMHRAGEIADRNGMRRTFVMAVFHRCAIEFRVLGWQVAGATLTEMEAMLPGARYPMAEAMLCLLQARRAQFRGQPNEAADLAELADAATLRIGSRYQEMLFGLIGAELLLDAGRVERARCLIERSRELIERAPAFDCWRAALRFVEALLARTDGDHGLAVTRLREALTLAKQGKRKYYLRHFECAMPPLFTLALEEGIEVDFVGQIIGMFRLKPPASVPFNWPWPVRIYTLGRFEVRVNGERLEFPRKLPRKTLLLLKAIVALGGRNVREQALCDALWGDEEGDAARNAFAITVVRLRKLLGSSDTILQRGGSVSLNPEMCWVDAQAFETRLGDDPPAGRSALSLYAGTFLPGDEDQAWSVASRERLRGRFIHALSMRGAALEAGNDAEAALECYLCGIDADPIVESFYLGLMRCYERLGRRTEALSAYRRLRHTLSVLLGVPPSEAAQRLFRSVLGNQAAGSAAEMRDGDGGSAAAEAASHGRKGVVTKLPARNGRGRN